MRETPKIFIDDTHLRKPTKIHHIKSKVLPPTNAGHKCNNFSHNNNNNNNNSAQNKFDNYLSNYKMQNPVPPVSVPVPQFKPLVQVDPTLLTTNRTPLANPRIGDYLLNKTASTEGIASKKSLELKKRYLLGEQSNGSKIQKSGSTSVLDSRIRSFQSNISECQKLLNPGNDISPSMKTFLDRTKLGEKGSNETVRTATNDILNHLRIEITVQKASSATSTDNEKENVFVNNKNELNKGIEYDDTVNNMLIESIENKSFTPQPKNNFKIIDTIDLVTPEKQNLIIEDSNKIIDLTCDTPEKEPVANQTECLYLGSDENISKTTIMDYGPSEKSGDNIFNENTKPDVSKDIKQSIPDILDHIDQEERCIETRNMCLDEDENKSLINNCEDNEEKADFPEKSENMDICDVKIEVPNIPWNSLKTGNSSVCTDLSCSSCSSSIEDIEHYILESTTSPETNNSRIIPNNQYQVQVPRVEVHDSSGTLMQIDSLMIIDGKYIGDPDDLKYMEIPTDLIIPKCDQPEIQNSVVEDHTEGDTEPLTISPEPLEQTVIDTRKEVSSAIKPSDLKFDTKNENKIESLKNLPLIVEQTIGNDREVIKPQSINLKNTPKSNTVTQTCLTDVDIDKTPTGDMVSRESDSETELTNTGQNLTETELSDWTADDCISENFVDLELILNSSRGTIKRNKKNRKKTDYSSLPKANDLIREMKKSAPVVEFDDILKSIDIDDIEFMDMGSDTVEPYHAATNTTLLSNRGYIEFVDTNTERNVSDNNQNVFTPITESQDVNKWIPQKQLVKRDEKLGIDYIEQGAYIMQDDLNKTPVNETPDGVSISNSNDNKIGHSIINSNALNAEDNTSAHTVQRSSNTVTGANSSSCNSASTNNKKAFNQSESEALTIVTSILDSSSVKSHIPSGIDTEAADESTPSSSERMPKTSLSTETTCSSCSSKLTPVSNNTQDEPTNGHAHNNNRKCAEEISYENYVRALQQKITQISAAHGDSLDSRKHRKKTSKNDETIAPSNIVNSTNDTKTVIEEKNVNLLPVNSIVAPTIQKNSNQNPSSMYENTDIKSATNNINHVNSKVPEIPTLTRKLEEITKERTKQKDLIHDLVMDKLQSKKQLNAEKRLNRSRQRSLLSSPNNKCQGNERISAPAMNDVSVEQSTIAGGTCTNNKAHYHVSTAASVNSESKPFGSSSFKENKSTSTSLYNVQHQQSSPTKAKMQRPFSENYTDNSINSLMSQFSQKVITANNTTGQTNEQSPPASSSYTPVPPLRQNRGHQLPTLGIARSATIGETTFSVLTENLRSEARARARLKSNIELGLSPEEKMNLLRKRLQNHYNDSNAKDSSIGNTSKSVNDLTCNNKLLDNQNYQLPSNNSIEGDVKAKPDFTSDPNISESLSSPTRKPKSERGVKNPDRRKSLIQSLSNFFHKTTSTTSPIAKSQEKKDNTVTTTSTKENTNTVPMDNPCTGVLSRFRISPKSKEKSKNKKELLSSCTSVSTQCLQIGKSSAATTIKSHDDLRSNTPHPYHTSSNNNYNCRHSNSIQSQNHQTTQQQQIQQSMNHASYKHNNEHCLNHDAKLSQKRSASSSALTIASAINPSVLVNKSRSMTNAAVDNNSVESMPPPIPPLPLNYQRSDDESNSTENREQKKQRALSKATRQAELKRLRIAQEIQREQEEIEVQLKELESRGVLIEKTLRGEVQNYDNSQVSSTNMDGSDEILLKELLEIWRNITHLKQRDEELSIRQRELQLEHRHAQLKEELNSRLSINKLEKSSADVAAEGAILNEMLEIVAKRAALRPSVSTDDIITSSDRMLTTFDQNILLKSSQNEHEQTLQQHNTDNESNV